MPWKAKKRPKLVDDAAIKIAKSKSLKDKWAAFAIAITTLTKAGELKWNTLTPLGKARQSLWEKWRNKETLAQTKTKLRKKK